MINLSQSLEDYLEAVYVLNLEKKAVRVKDIAKMLEVKTPSVVDAVSKLVSSDLVVHEKYGYLYLTDKGKKQGEIIYKKHSEIFKFLNNILDIDEETAKKDACGIEHYISKDAIEKIIKFTKFIESNCGSSNDILSDFKHFLRKD